MTIRSVITTAGMLMLAASVSAQNPPQTPTPAAKPSTAQAPKATVEGCLRTEAGVPGRTPNVAEKAGIMEDYILTDAKVIKGTVPMAKASDKPAAARPAAQPMMFEVTGLDDEQLKNHVGKRVQVDGEFENVDDARDDEGENRVEDLVEIDGTAIRVVSGTCPAK
jgi:hypothetical protein